MLDVFDLTGSQLVSSSAYALPTTGSIKIVYLHEQAKSFVYFDDTLHITANAAIERAARYLLLGVNGYNPSIQQVKGYLSNFKLYDNLALLPD